MTGNEYLTSRAVAYFGHWFMIVATALVVWWLHRYVPFIPPMGFGTPLALVVVVHVLRRWA
jgi:hypothetical protein